MPLYTDHTTLHSRSGRTVRSLGRPLGERGGLRYRRQRRYRRGYLALLAPFGLLLTWLAGRFPAALERLYARGLYRLLAGSFGRLFGLLPFSLAEFLIWGLLVLTLCWLVYQGVCLARRPEKQSRLLAMLATAGCVAGVGLFLFTLLCGLNYHRLPFANSAGLTVRESTVDELAGLYEALIAEANAAREPVAQTPEGVMALDGTAWQAAADAPAAMGRAAEDFTVLGGYTPRPKPMLGSRLMSMMDITGVYIPFTFEGNFNADAPAMGIPFSMLHELAHYKGFMREDEANFIAYAACRASGWPDFTYSGAVQALIHTGNALYAANSELYFTLNEQLAEPVRRDMAASAAYWKQFEGPVAEVAAMANNAYLKTNAQQDGVRSYGRMVDLLLADYRQRQLAGE